MNWTFRSVVTVVPVPPDPVTPKSAALVADELPGFLPDELDEPDDEEDDLDEGEDEWWERATATPMMIPTITTKPTGSPTKSHRRLVGFVGRHPLGLRYLLS